jgi:ribosomal protein S18 acetylase RimI-like enzyme
VLEFEWFRVRPLEDCVEPQTLRFINSWRSEDVYGRFGTAGIDAEKLLAGQLTQRRRSALVAMYRDQVVGLLDYVYVPDEIHIGIVVDWRFRRLSIGTKLIRALLKAKSPGYGVVAECRMSNRSAIALLAASCFRLVSAKNREMTWRIA